MDYLLDTHIALWALDNDTKLSKEAKEMSELKYGCVYLTELVKNRRETDNITVAAIKTM